MAQSIFVPQAGGIIDFPDEATPQEMLSYIDKKYGAPAPAAPPASDVGAWESAGLGWLSRFQTAGGGISEMLGQPEYAKYFYDKAQANLNEAAKYQPEEQSILGAETWGGSASALGEAAIQSAPDLAGGLLASAGTGAAAGSLAGPVGAGIGALIGGGLYAFGSSLGSNIQRQAQEQGTDLQAADEATAATAAALQAPLEAIADRILLGRLLPEGATLQIARRIVGDGVVKHAIKGAGAEGLTEAAQQAIELGQANPEKLFEFSPDVQRELADAAIAGGFLGGVAGGILDPAGNYLAGRKDRQLKRDLTAEQQQAGAELSQGRIAQSADELVKAGVRGEVSIEEVEDPAGFTKFTLKDKVGQPIADFDSIDAAARAIVLYKRKSGVDVNVRAKGAEPAGPEGPIMPPGPKVPLRVGKTKFPDIAALQEARKKHLDEIAKINIYKGNGELLVKQAAANGVTPIVYAQTLDNELTKNKVALKKYDDYIASLSSQEAPITTPTVPAPVAPPVTPTVEAPEVAAEPEGIAALESNVPAEVVAPEPITDYPIGVAEAPVTDEAVPDRAVIEEEPAAPVEPLPEMQPLRQEMRTTATMEQLTDLQTELFGKPTNVRQMTPEQLSQYEAERDRRFPQEPVDIYYSGSPTTAAPTLKMAQVTGPNVKDYSPETQAWIKGVYTKLQNRLSGIVPKQAEVRLQTLIDRGPGYLIRGQASTEPSPDGIKSIIDLSTGILKPDMTVEDAVKVLVETLNHEIIHVIRQQGVIRPEEWRILSRAAMNTKVPGKKYTYLDKAEAVYAPNGVPMSEEYADPDAVVEEAVAEMYKDWVKKQNAPPQTRGLFNRITEFFRRIFRVLRDSRHEEFFKAVERGEVGGREARPTESTAKFSATPVGTQGYTRENPTYTEQFVPGTRKREYFITGEMSAAAAPKAFTRLNNAARLYPNPLANDQAWLDTLSYSYNQRNDLIMPPGWGIAMANDVDSWATWMKGLTPDQLSGVDSGFASIASIANEYKNGTAKPEFTGTLLFWTYLSRMASSFPHESGFLDAAEGAMPFIRKAINGTFTADESLVGMTAPGKSAKTLKEQNGFSASALPADIAVAGRSDLDDWFLFVRRSIPDYSPGNSVTNNMNSYGRDFLLNMSAPAPGGGGKSKLSAVHDLFSSNKSGAEIRREFHRIRDNASLGFDNKILSFAILLSGKQDVLILDRIQINQIFGGGQTNKIYDDVHSHFDGPKGLAVYEALERGFSDKVSELYRKVGRPNDGTLGRYHWESWIRSSGQIVAHPTLQALVNLAKGASNPFIDIPSAEGRYHRSMFGVQYVRRANGVTEFVYTTVDGKEYSVGKNDLDTILSKDNLLRIGAIPKWFPGVSDFEGGLISWKDYPGVDIAKVDSAIAASGRLIGNGRSNQTINQNTLQSAAADAARAARARTIHDAANRIRWEFGRKPVGGKPTDRIPEPYERASGSDAGRDVVATYAPKAGVEKILREAGVSAPEFLELSPSAKSASKFSNAIRSSKENNSFGAAVYVYSEEDYASMRLFITDDGTAGFAIKPDGDIVSVFNIKGGPHKAVTIPAVQLAVQLGGRKLDGFDTILPSLYSQAGMSVVARTKFADLPRIRPDDWDYSTFGAFNGGRPDVVFMAFDPGNWSVYKPTDGTLYTDTNPDPYVAAENAYNRASATQNSLLYSEPAPKEKAPRATRGARLSATPVMESPEFKRWFRNSVTVDANGNPIRFYHGTPFSFKEFGKGRSGSVKNETGPFYFSTSPKYANQYAETKIYAGGDGSDVKKGGKVFPVYISAQNPFDYENPEHVARLQEFIRSPLPKIKEGFWKTIENPATQRAIRDLGFDGFYLNEAGFKNLAVYRPEQVKSIFNQFPEGEAERARFSAAPLPPYVQQQNNSLFAPTPKVSFKDMMFNFAFGSRPISKTLNTQQGVVDLSTAKMAALTARSAAVDKGAYIEELEKQLNKQTTGNFQRMVADYSATAALAWRRRATHLLASMMLRGKMNVNFARPGDIQSATMQIVDDPDSMKNIFDILLQPGPINPTTGKPDDKRDIFKSYAVAKRGEWLAATGQTVPREITPQYIRETIAFTQREYPEVIEAYNMYQRFNKNLLTAAKDAGLISDAELARLTSQMNYYGFIYEVYGEPLGPSTAQKTASKFKLRPYTGTQYGGMTADPMFVMIQNANFWVESMAKNLAAVKSFKLAELMREARLLGSTEDPDPSRGEENDVMYFSENGQVKKFAVRDPLLVVALGSDDRIDVGRFWEIVGIPTRILRESVTRDPGFMVANLMRDTLSTWITSGADITPFLGTMKGMANALKGGASFKTLGSYGVVGSYDLAMLGPAELANTLRQKSMPKNVHTVGTLGMGTAALGSLWNRLGAVSEASDAATRIAVYEAAKAKGLSDAEAALQAIEILDFTRRGGSQALGILTKIIPFLNARIQGMDVLYQAGRAGLRYMGGRTRGERDANLGKQFLIRGAMLAAISLALEWINDDDEDYEQLDDYIKNGNLIIPLSPFGLDNEFIAVPKPFESGLLFSTSVQQFYKSFSGDASSRDNIALFTSQITSTFGVNPFPQILLPAYEVITNHDFYTGLPLISEGKMRLAPELQYNASTSQVAMILGKLPIKYNFDSGKFEGISPIVIDNLISGYGGPLGTYLVQATGIAMEGVDIGPERIPQDITRFPVVKRFFIDAESKNPKVVSQAYELFRLADEANRSFSRLRQTGDAEAVADYLDENRDILAYKKYIFKMADRLNKLSAQERVIERDQTMTDEEKIEAVRKLREVSMRIAAKVSEINRVLGR